MFCKNGLCSTGEDQVQFDMTRLVPKCHRPLITLLVPRLGQGRMKSGRRTFISDIHSSTVVEFCWSGVSSEKVVCGWTRAPLLYDELNSEGVMATQSHWRPWTGTISWMYYEQWTETKWLLALEISFEIKSLDYKCQAIYLLALKKSHCCSIYYIKISRGKVHKYLWIGIKLSCISKMQHCMQLKMVL